jgi:hypothetical protein
VWLSLLATLALVFVLHRAGRLHALLVTGLAAVASGVVWIMVVRTMRLPSAMTVLPQKDAVIHRPVASSSREAFWVGESGLVRVELPSLRIAAVLPWPSNRLGLVTHVAWSGHALLVMGHDGTTGTFGIARDDAWVVAPRPSPDSDASAAGYWDREAHAFVLSSHSPSAATTRAFTFVDEAGTLLNKLTIATPLEMIAPIGLCESDGDVVAMGGYATCRTKKPLSESSTWACERGPIGAIPYCPGHLSMLRAHAWIAPSGIASHPALPSVFTMKFDRDAYDPEVLLGDGRVEPRDVRRGTDYSTLVRIDGGFLRAKNISNHEAKALGHTPAEEVTIERYDEQGQLVAQNAVLSPPPSWRIVPMGAEVAVVSDSLDRAARFDAKTLARLDPPKAPQALRDRLERWGGPSVIYRAAVGISLALGPMTPIFVLAWLFARKNPSSYLAMGLPRVVAVLLVIAVPTFAETITRYYYV